MPYILNKQKSAHPITHTTNVFKTDGEFMLLVKSYLVKALDIIVT